jgi:hypothetical protein
MNEIVNKIYSQLKDDWRQHDQSYKKCFLFQILCPPDDLTQIRQNLRRAYVDANDENTKLLFVPIKLVSLLFC